MATKRPQPLKVLFLDDDPERHAEFHEKHPTAVHVRTVDEACKKLGAQRFDLVYLDRDLNDYPEVGVSVSKSGRQQTGTEVAEFIIRQSPSRRPRLVIVHSRNPFYAPLMVEQLRTAGVQVIREPYIYQSEIAMLLNAA